jgi:hypothetical protein
MAAMMAESPASTRSAVSKLVEQVGTQHNGPMPNLATLLKNEISRVARKEQRGESLALKKSVSAHRADIAALKRRSSRSSRSCAA